MRWSNIEAIQNGDPSDTSLNSEPIPVGQGFSGSFQILLNSASMIPSGTGTLQFSNDPENPTHWSDVPGTTLSINNADITSYITEKLDLSCEFLRVSYAGIGRQLITVHADSSGLPQITYIGVLGPVTPDWNDTYFYINSAGDDNEYYVWLNVDSMGTDPMIPGKTGVEIVLADEEEYDLVILALSNALVALNSGLDFSCSSEGPTLIVTNVSNGVTTNADGLDTPFLVETAQEGQDTNPAEALNNKYFFLNAPTAFEGLGTPYYFWYNVNGMGTDPMVPGKEGVEVSIPAGSDIFQVQVSTTEAILNIPGPPFFADSYAEGIIIVQNIDPGPFVPASDFNTGFTFEILEESGTFSAQVFLQGD